MCGILGAVPSVEKLKFQKVLGLLEHRGPDGFSVWHEDGGASLGHRRLAILDTSNLGTQPMAYLDRYYLVFNGEIYNFLEVQKDLIAKGYTFKSTSDTEVLLAAFVEWGEACVHRLNGMWAFAIWDRQEKRLFLSRDRMGEKPLYYIQSGNQFVFASEQKALLPYLNQVRPSSRFQWMAAHAYAYESTEECVFEGVRRFPAAHVGWLINGRLNKKRYWNPLESQAQVPTQYEKQVEALRELLVDSCRMRMRADVPIGTGLSGGVDSSAIAATIAEVAKRSGQERVSKNWQNSFVASFPGTVMDESSDALRVAEHLGIQHNPVIIDPSAFVSRLENIIFLFEDIHEVNPIPHVALYQAMRAKGVVVTLDGHGGDELFCGYESSILHALPDAKANTVEMREIFETYEGCHPKNEFFRGMTPRQVGWYLFKAKIRMMLQQGILTEERLKWHYGALNAHLYELSFLTVLPTLLRNYDRYSMSNGVEIRMPLIDHRIVEFALAIPWRSKVKNGFTKAILRDSVAPWLPRETMARKMKIGFASPIYDWMRGPLKTYLLDEVESRSFQQADLIDAKILGSKIKEIVTGNEKSILYTTEQTWKQLHIYLWEKAFIKDQVWKK